jgi:hypothetical protein
MVMGVAFVDVVLLAMKILVACAVVVMYQVHDYVDVVRTFYLMDLTS